MKELLEDTGKVTRCREHDTIIAKVVDILPMKTIFDEQLGDIQVTLEGRPMERVGSDLFCASHYNCSELGFDFKVLLSCSFGD